jgi:hypothetical protein
MGPLLTLVLTATPYFFTDDHALYRAVVQPVAAAQSGAQPAQELSRSRIELPGLVMGHTQRGPEAVAVVCPRTLARTDAAHGCEVFHVDARGNARALGVLGLSAELAPGNREVLVWTEDLKFIRLTLATGATLVLASEVLEPRLSADGLSFAFARAPGLTRLTPGFVACPFTQGLGGEAVRVGGPCDAQAPFVSPSGAALYVTTDGGMAALVHHGRTIAARVPGRELVWLDGDRALYSAHYEAQELWVFDARTQRARQVGLGREPAILEGSVFAFDGQRVVQVEVGP